MELNLNFVKNDLDDDSLGELFYWHHTTHWWTFGL